MESITIYSEGLMLNSYLRVQEMKIKLNQIMVHPFKALMGNIQLLQPSLGTIHVVLIEEDIVQSLRAHKWSETIEDKLLGHLSIQQVSVLISEQGQISITTQLEVKSTGEIQEVLLKVFPTLDLYSEIVLKEIQQTEDKLVSLVNKIILKELKQVLNFNSFHIDGLDLKMQQLTFQPSQLILQGIAVMSKFPGT